MAPFRGSFISRLTSYTDPPIFRIAATRKRNGVEISNSQNFLVSMISTSILNKKKIHDIGCTPLFELGWNDPDVIHCFCAEVYSNLTPPDQWITSVIVPLPRKGDLSLMTNYRGISLLSIAAKVYNKILLNRIRDEVDPIFRKNQDGFRPGRSCAQQIHILRRVLEGFRDYQLPLVVTFIDFKKAFDSINRKVMFAVL